MGQTVKVAVYSVDPPGLSTFSTFDPESFTVISLINDGLIYIDIEGDVQPALATSWRRISALEMEFTLRPGVRFHNGEPFDADSVVATFQAHRLPTPSACGRAILSVVTGASKIDDFTVRLQTAFPDAMLLRRLFVSSIYPKGVLAKHGREHFATQPIGTGPYRFVAHRPGREIVLERNPDHWSGRDSVDCIRLPILRQKEWIDRLERGEIDVALGLDSHDHVRASRIAGLEVVSRQAAITQSFLLANRGPLADVRVRRALNHAINRRLLVDVAEHGFGSPQRSIATEGQQGYTPCEPYRYSPELARSLLDAAGHGEGILLRGLVSETSTAVYFTVKEFLARVGVQLEAEIVPRVEWIRRIAHGNLEGPPYDGDFAVAVFDNPILHTLFHHFIFLFDHGPFALLRDADYSRQFLKTATTFADSEADAAQAALERYTRDQALVLFTVHEDVHAAFREGFSCSLPRSGHFQMDALMSLRAAPTSKPAQSIPPARDIDLDVNVLLEATSHAGAFFLRPGATFDKPVLKRVWDNIQTSEERWRLQNEPMLRALVSQVEAKTNLANVLGSTERVAIAGYSAEGRCLFVNRGYELMFGAGERSAFEHLATQWEAMRAEVELRGSWLGPVHLTSAGRPRGASDRLYLSVTRAVDEEGTNMGFTFVFSDFSGEEERIRTQATRTILSNVPYGLFMCDAEGRVLEGYSDACTRIFADAARGITGRMLSDLLGMDARAAGHFESAHEQIFDDLLPAEVNVGNLPERITIGSRTYSSSCSVVRAADGSVAATLFTLVDISALIEAEHEIESLRSTLRVLRYRTCFEDFAIELHHELERLTAQAAAGAAGAAQDSKLQDASRLALHTAKGVFGQFGFNALAQQIHAIEDNDTIAQRDLRAVHVSLHELIERNAPLWNIRLERREARYTTTESRLAELEATIAAATSLADVQALARRGFERIRSKPVAELLGPMEESCAQQAQRRGKKVRFELEGAEVAWPVELSEVFAVLPHVIRNSIDHGIEAPHERAAKDEVATIRVDVVANDNGLHISLQDDGRGIAVERVTRRALELGAIDAARLATMSTQERLQLIFLSGLSTADRVSDTSGRGMGMSAVKQTVESLGGTLTLSSEAGQGTALRIAFPRRRAA